MAAVVADEYLLDKPRHIKYWLRCLKTVLPHHYTGNESNRMYLAFLILCALDLLDALTTHTTSSERASYADWIYHCQHPDGGFRMWPGTNFDAHASDANAHWDPAHVPATYFALASLLILGDDLGRVRRKEALGWLREMQRVEGEGEGADGSFGETRVKGVIQGGRDPRFAYCAMGVRFVLRGKEGEGALEVDGERVEDVDVDRLVRCIREAESYDGGIADEPFSEPHAGYTYCALGALAFCNRLPPSHPSSPPISPATAPTNPLQTLRWLIERQTTFIDPDLSPPSSPSPFPPHPSLPLIAGMNGRPNKVADTCYAWWVLGGLALLGYSELADRDAVRRYLLGVTQHPFLAGFGKGKGDPPDVYHSCLGLMVLGLLGEGEGEGVKAVDPGMCVSREVRGRLDRIWEGWG